MDSVRFHLQEKYGKLYLEINQPELYPSYLDEVARHDYYHHPHFLCPEGRRNKDSPGGCDPFPLTSSHKYVRSTTKTQQDQTSVYNEHPVHPYFLFHRTEAAYFHHCKACDSEFCTDYYLCEYHDSNYHKECVESPLKIKHPYHLQHPLQLYSFQLMEEYTCFCCGFEATLLIYCCFKCNIFMHPFCAMQPIPFLIEKPKRHHHPLSFFTRQTCLVCNVCGLSRESYPTYICVRCNFVSHKDCMSSPTIIKISRHHHRISHTCSLLSDEYSCGVCRQSINGDYGAYTCGKCSDYAVHSRCALQTNVWDEKELEGVPDEDYTIQDVEPFEVISQGVILHFLHDHHLLLKVNMFYDEKKLCGACVLPIYEGKFYSCMKCDFILHESCANSPRMIQHGTHPHPLELINVGSFLFSIKSGFPCYTCHRTSNGFNYICRVFNCEFTLDVRCASISEPFDYKGHEHALFLALNSAKDLICQVCKKECIQPLNCIKCSFVVCFKCASLPYKVRYKHDEHFLTILWGEEACEKDWCEECEGNLEGAFYSCKECCTFLHTECLLGTEPYWRRR